MTLPEIPTDVIQTVRDIARRLSIHHSDTDRIETIARAILAERERCAAIAYRTCAETRHVTLGDACAEAIRT